MTKKINAHKKKVSASYKKSLIIVSILITVNLLWYLLIDNDQSTSITLAIISPICYGILYFLFKKIRTKNKIKPYLTIPVIYTIFSLVWYFGFSFFDANPSNIFTSNSDVNLLPTEFKSENPNYILIQKLGLKHFFLDNPNLSLPSKTIQILEKKIRHQNKNITIQPSKEKTYNMIIFGLLFLIQVTLIYLVEEVIYPQIKPQSTRRHRIRKLNYKKLELTDYHVQSGDNIRIRSKEENQQNNPDVMNKKENDFPSL